MKTLVIYRMVGNKVWYYADPMIDKIMIRNVCAKLAPLRDTIDLWLADNPGNNAAIEHEDERLPLMTDADWAVALLRFGP
jgi:hypothetical protein